MSSLLIIDDHPVVRQGLAQLLSAMRDIDTIRQASTGAEAMAQYALARPDGVILDLALGAESGLDVLRRLLNTDASARVMILTMHDESLYAARALRAGARGYMMKHEATDAVIGSVRKLLAGELVFSRAVQEQILLQFARRPTARADSGVSALTDRELEVLRLIGLGLPSTQIAARLARSVKTVEAHRASIRSKLGLQSPFELVRFAMHWMAPDGRTGTE